MSDAETPLPAETGSGPEVLPASGTVVGKTCPHCEQALLPAAPFVSCRTCLAPQHAGCWQQGGGCGSYFCTRETTRPLEELGPARIVITREDTERPPPAAASLPRRPAPSPVPVRTDPYATTSLLLGAASFLFLGCLSGPIAALLGAISLGRIAATGELTGRGRAAGGFVLGVLSTVLWLGVGGWLLQRQQGEQFDSPFLEHAELPTPPSPGDLDAVAGPIRQALRSNVFIEGSAGFASTWVGSGIVVQATATHIRVLTNRHVSDGHPYRDDARLTVRTVHGDEAPATVLWRAEGGIDMALLEAPLAGADQRVAVARVAAPAGVPAIGTRVFAVGNPQALGWSYTEGVVSSRREHSQDGRRVVFIQTQTPINPGNSGGGLYDMDGYLVGMNSWKISESVGEGLGFAIAVPSLLEQRSDLVEVVAREGGAPAPLERPDPAPDGAPR